MTNSWPSLEPPVLGGESAALRQEPPSTDGFILLPRARNCLPSPSLAGGAGSRPQPSSTDGFSVFGGSSSTSRAGRITIRQGCGCESRLLPTFSGPKPEGYHFQRNPLSNPCPESQYPTKAGAGSNAWNPEERGGFSLDRNAISCTRRAVCRWVLAHALKPDMSLWTKSAQCQPHPFYD